MTNKILIADDHPLFRRGVKDVLEAAREYDCIEATDGIEALTLIKKEQPHIAILDLSMPKVDGFDVLSQAIRWPNSPYFVILTFHDDTQLIERAYDLGASAYLLKEDAEDELLKCLTTVIKGKRYLSHSIVYDPDSGHFAHEEMISSLTPAEQRIIKLVGKYKTSREIADLLNVSVRTIQNHRAHIMKKLNLVCSLH